MSYEVAKDCVLVAQTGSLPAAKSLIALHHASSPENERSGTYIIYKNDTHEEVYREEV